MRPRHWCAHDMIGRTTRRVVAPTRTARDTMRSVVRTTTRCPRARADTAGVSAYHRAIHELLASHDAASARPLAFVLVLLGPLLAELDMLLGQLGARPANDALRQQAESFRAAL